MLISAAAAGFADLVRLQNPGLARVALLPLRPSRDYSWLPTTLLLPFLAALSPCEDMMTPIKTAVEITAYEIVVMGIYLDLPDTPMNFSGSDRRQVQLWYQRGVPLRIAQAALWLGSIRRLRRPAEALPLAPIRSLAYFQPVVEELLQTPVPDEYCAYLRSKMEAYLRDHPG